MQLLLAMLGLLALASASAVTLRDDLPLPVTPMMFNGELGGHNVSLTGNVQQIMAQMKELYPGFEIPQVLVNNLTHTRDLVSRGKDGIICGSGMFGIPGHSWKQAYESEIFESMLLLRALGQGNCGVQAHSCTSLGCNGGSGIFLCNDSDDFYHPNCDYLATYAGDICNECFEFWTLKEYLVLGQEFDSDKYNVIVRWGCNV